MNRNFISQLLRQNGIEVTDEQEKAITDAVLDKVHEELDQEKQLTQAEKDKARDAQDTLAEVQKKYDTALKNTDNIEALKGEIEKIKSDNKAKIDDIEKNYQSRLLNSAIELALTKAGARNNKAAAALIDTADLKLSDDGSVVGLSEMIDKVKQDEATSFLFDKPQTEEQPHYNYIPQGSQKEQKADPVDQLYNSISHENNSQIIGWE